MDTGLRNRTFLYSPQEVLGSGHNPVPQQLGVGRVMVTA